MSRHTYDIDVVLNKGMLPVVRKRDILRARVLTREEKKELPRGGPDVVTITPSGQKIMMKRTDITSRYTYLDGKKISMAGWTSSKEYVIARLDNTEALAIMVPADCSLEVNGQYANSSKRKTGDYVVGLLDSSGAIDKNTLGIVPSAMFKKMYYMPPNEVIARNLRNKHKEVTAPTLQNNRSNIVSSVREQPDYTGALGMDTSSFDFGDSDIYKEANKKQVQSTLPKTSIKFDKEPEKTEKQSDYKYFATGRLVDQAGETVGFVIQNKEGQTRNITKGQMMEVCKKKLVSNIMVGIKADTGKAYLRGNNIRIDMLPSYPANLN